MPKLTSSQPGMPKAAEEMKLTITVVMNKRKSKVLFVEAGSDFTDVLLSFLHLPLGMILKVLEKHYGDKSPAIGSLSTLYNGVANLDVIHFQSEAAKQSLLFPMSSYESEARKLRLSVNFPQSPSPGSRKTYDGVYTESADSFIISDDLQVMQNVAGTFMKTVIILGIAADMDGAETKTVTFGLDEIVSLLRASMVSRNPFTALFCGYEMGLAPSKFDQGNASFHQIDPKVTSKNTKKMIVHVAIQKSSNKLLFAQADYEFISFLFGMLTVPLGRVAWYFGSSSGLKCVDNLHSSISDESKKVHLKSAETKGFLMKSSLLASQEFCNLNFDPDSFKNHNVKGVRKYMISDDLTVAPLGMTSCLSVIEGLKIPVSDVQELELQVGMEEGLSILKAALTSTTALTDGLIKHLPKAKASQPSLTPNAVRTDALASPMTCVKRPKLENSYDR